MTDQTSSDRLEWLPPVDAAFRLGCNVNRLRILRNRGHIMSKPDPTDGRRVVYSVDDIDGLVATGRGSASHQRWGEWHDDPTVPAARVLRRARQRAELTSAEVARMVGVSHSDLVAYEHGRYHPMGTGLVQKLAHALQMTVMEVGVMVEPYEEATRVSAAWVKEMKAAARKRERNS